MLTVQLKDIMTQEVVTSSPHSTTLEVVRQLHSHNIGSVVITEGDTLAGIVTESDVIGQVAEDRLDREVAEFMSSPVVTSHPSDTVQDAVNKLKKHRIKHLPVMEDRLVGILSTRDLSYYMRRPHENRLSDSLEVSYEDEEWEFEHLDTDKSESVSVGDKVRFTRVLDEEDVRQFAEASGDTNRVHLDEEFASRTRFGKRIVHGTLVSGLISSALARIPGLTIYLSQDLSFLNPVGIGEKVTAVCEVREALGKNRFRLVTCVYGGSGDVVIDGEATVLIDPLPEGS